MDPIGLKTKGSISLHVFFFPEASENLFSCVLLLPEATCIPGITTPSSVFKASRGQLSLSYLRLF